MFVTLVTIFALASLVITHKGVTLCSGAYFQGECMFVALSDNTCLPLPCDAGFGQCPQNMDMTWKSFAPSRGVACRLHASSGCSSGGLRADGIVLPGTPDLVEYGKEDVRGYKESAVTYLAYQCWG